MRKTLGVLAHVDAGKTTFSEQALVYVHALRAAGRVDHADSFLDMHPMERARGITIFSDQARFDWAGDSWTWVDTPGHVDFSSEMERAISVMDYAVLIISCVEGVQSHTQTVWRLLKDYHVPVFVFLNKTDREGADPDGVIAQIRDRLTGDILDLRGALKPDGALSDEAAEAVAAYDEGLLERLFDTGYDREAWLQTLRALVKSRAVFPLMAGSALKGEGVAAFMDMLRLLTVTDYESRENEPLRGVVQKVRFDEQGNRLTFIKLTAGTLGAREEIATPEGPAKAGEMRLYHGAKFTTVPTARAGELVAVQGLQGVRPGDTVGEGARRGRFETAPLMVSRVIWPENIHPTRMLEALKKIEEEEPLLGVEWHPETRAIDVQVMGKMQLDVLKALVHDRFGLDIAFGASKPRYMETIADTTYGIGHYEPLRHYAEAHLRLDPLPAGSGVTFASECHVDDLALNWQRLIETHVFEKTHHGILTGAPLTDVRVTLLAGRAHLKHTEGGDFREATYRAIRNALMRGRGVLLEPVCRFELRAPEEAYGRLTGDLQRLKADYEARMEAGEVIMTGEAAFSALSDYSETLAALTHGRGALSWRLSRYRPCENQDEIVAEANYNPFTDGSPDSVFCAKGAGYTVAWDKVIDFAHCESAARKPSPQG